MNEWEKTLYFVNHLGSSKQAIGIRIIKSFFWEHEKQSTLKWRHSIEAIKLNEIVVNLERGWCHKERVAVLIRTFREWKNTQNKSTKQYCEVTGTVRDLDRWY